MGRPNIVERTKILLRRAEACRLRVAGYTYEQIAETMGYSSAALVRNDVKRALDRYVEEQKRPIEELRARELAALDRAQQVVTEVMESDHLKVNNGQVVMYHDPERGEDVKLLDEGPKLAAVDRVVKISESRRKLLGQDAPSKVETQVGGTVEYVMKVSQEEMDQL